MGVKAKVKNTFAGYILSSLILWEICQSHVIIQGVFMKNIPFEEEKAVIKKAIIDYYHEGHVKSDPELYKKILHDEWKMSYFDEKGKLIIVGRPEYFSWYDPERADKKLKWETEFEYINITKNIASVKLRIRNQQFGYIDYFNMVKTDGRWLIIHKISQGEK